jgi:RloB-like protein
MGRERRPFKRPGFVRDSHQLFVVACEGQVTEKRYLDELNASHGRIGVFVEVLQRQESGSSPERVMRQLNDFKREYRLKAQDQLWMLIDRDKQSWTTEAIAQVARLCIQKGFSLAVTNPCFELWLLLHVHDIDTMTTAEKNELLANRKDGSSRTCLERKLSLICGGYSKTHFDPRIYTSQVFDAIARAERLEGQAQGRWPENRLGTQIHLLVQKLIA